eukprot:TRINITY_DN6408_c0_g1_i1.p1 TRINITY_DN6408_c0_g1~~TRINITY_DN6408_c0_g1_i1.p1  ORF type:complete len:333 (-),score=56.16 TRINITY_DN6408_c0_g1_i1:164-1162(-)
MNETEIANDEAKIADYHTDNPLLYGLTETQVDDLYALLFRLNLASVVLSGLSLLTYFLNEETRRKGNATLSFYFGIASCGFNLSLLMVEFVDKDNFLDGEMWCKAQAFIVEFFLNGILMWWFFMTFHMWFSIVRGRLEMNREGSKYYHLVGWGSSLIISFSIFQADEFGNSGFWCWIKGRNFDLQLTVFYLQMCVYLVVGALMWMSTIYKVSKIMAQQGRGGTNAQRRGFYLRVLRQIFFIVCFCIVFCIAFSNRVRLDENRNINNLYGLWELHIVTAGIIGILYFFVFLTFDFFKFWNDKIQQLFRVTWSRSGSNTSTSTRQPILTQNSGI